MITRLQQNFVFLPCCFSFSLSWSLRTAGRPENNSTLISCSKWASSRAYTCVFLSQLPQYEHTNYQTSAGLRCNIKPPVLVMDWGRSFLVVWCLFFKRLPLYPSNESWTMEVADLRHPDCTHVHCLQSRYHTTWRTEGPICYRDCII